MAAWANNLVAKSKGEVKHMARKFGLVTCHGLKTKQELFFREYHYFFTHEQPIYVPVQIYHFCNKGHPWEPLLIEKYSHNKWDIDVRVFLFFFYTGITIDIEIHNAIQSITWSEHFYKINNCILCTWIVYRN